MKYERAPPELSQEHISYLRNHPEAIEWLESRYKDRPKILDWLWRLVYAKRTDKIAEVDEGIEAVSFDEVLKAVENGILPMPKALIEEDFAPQEDAKRDARAILDKLPERLLEIAQKREDGYPLTHAEQVYLLRCREKYKSLREQEND